LKDLREGTTYHYRVVVKDEDGAVVTLPDRTFTTKTFTDEVKLYQKDFTHTVEGSVRPGLWITEPGVYVLMEDIVSDGLGINAKSHDITIDLNGHTLVYDNGRNPFHDEDQYNESASFGIRTGLWNFLNTRIYNGVIKQGKTGAPGHGPIFLYHMGGATENEIAGITIDYYSDGASGMYTGKGYIHHNLLYDRGKGIPDRHMGVRALAAEPGSEAAYNSLRRFRHRGIDAATIVRDNELYSDSFATNSFALSAGDNATVKNNRVFGMGYHPIGIGWGNNLLIKDNFIYLWTFSPTQRSDEYVRSSGTAGMRVTNLDNRPFFENLLVEGNLIVLKVMDHNTLARGIWTTNGMADRNLLYRHNIVKVEAMPGNFTTDVPWNGDIFYNGDANNAITAVTVQGTDWVSEDAPDALVFEDNRFISNVNHIIIGEGYGITGGVRFYRTTFEKIDHDNDHFFAPVRIGFWYWNTFKNRIIDAKLVGITEDEMTPRLYGGSGKMDVSYGASVTFEFRDGEGLPIPHRSFTLDTEGSGIAQTRMTNAAGRASFDILSVKYFKYGSSLEDGGESGEPGEEAYGRYTFSAEGYGPYSYVR
jgi:hypothetical protein